MMLQLNPTIDVATPFGDGEAIMVIDYGVNVNTVSSAHIKVMATCGSVCLDMGCISRILINTHCFFLNATDIRKGCK